MIPLRNLFRISGIASFSRSMVFKLMASNLLLIVFAVLLIGLFSFRASEKIINEQVRTSNEAALSQINNNISNMIEQIAAFTSIYTFDQEFIKYSKKSYSNDVEKVLEGYKIEDRISYYTSSFYWLNASPLLIGQNGTIYTINSETSVTDYDTIKKQSWYDRLFSNRGKILWIGSHKGFTEGSKNSNMFTAAKVLENPDNLEVYGLLLLSFDESQLFNIYRNSLNKGTEIFIVDSTGLVISHSNRKKVGTVMPEHEFNRLMHGNLERINESRSDGIKRMVLVSEIPKAGWYIVEDLPLSSLFGYAENLKTEIIFIVLFCGLLSSFAAVLISRHLAMPLVKLAKRVRSYSTYGNFEGQRPALLSEIEILGKEYDSIILRLEKTIDDMIKEQEQKRRAELHALQMQINPHFLYNTLNSIKCLVWTNKSELIEPTLNAFIKLLRQTVGKNEEIITIIEEINNVECYVYIQQIRTSTPISLTYHMSKGLEACKIPKLILQPIVENAIFHGIEPKNENGRISIYCTSAEGTLSIEVQDNGIGIGPEKLSELLTGNNRSDKISFSGIGVRNADERLKLLYGPRYGLCIKSEPGTGTLVTMTLPEIH